MTEDDGVAYVHYRVNAEEYRRDFGKKVIVQTEWSARMAKSDRIEQHIIGD